MEYIYGCLYFITAITSLPIMSNFISNAVQSLGYDVFWYEIEKQSDTNVLLSPINLVSSLVLLQSGTTNNSILMACKLTSMEEKDVHQYMHMFIKLLNQRKIMKMNNLMCLKDQEVRLCPVFTTIASDYYHAKIMGNMDFSMDSQQCLKNINDWIFNQTEGKLQEAVKTINPLTVLALVSTLYFQSDWAQEFDQNKSFEDYFFVEDGLQKSIVTTFMTKTHDFQYFANKNCEVLKLPYQNNYSMIIFLPSSTLFSLKNVLSPQFLNDTLRSLQSRKVCVTLPIFKVSYASELLDCFKHLGMNFENMDRLITDYALDLSSFQQKTVIEVNEKGTEGGSMAFSTFTVLSLPEKPVKFTADHPFIYLIIENVSKICVFIGCMRDPSKVEKFSNLSTQFDHHIPSLSF